MGSALLCDRLYIRFCNRDTQCSQRRCRSLGEQNGVVPAGRASLSASGPLASGEITNAGIRDLALFMDRTRDR